MANINSIGDIIINGVKYIGNNIIIKNDSICIDGKTIKCFDDKIVIEGNVGSIESDKSITVNGNIEGSVTSKGSVNCNNIVGDVQANGSVNCDDIIGNINAMGSINCVSYRR